MASKKLTTKSDAPASSEEKPAKRPVGRPRTGKTYITRSFAIPKHNYQAIVDQFTAIIQAERAKKASEEKAAAEEPKKIAPKAQKPAKKAEKKETAVPVPEKKEPPKPAAYDAGVSSYLKKRQGQKNGIK